MENKRNEKRERSRTNDNDDDDDDNDESVRKGGTHNTIRYDHH